MWSWVACRRGEGKDGERTEQGGGGGSGIGGGFWCSVEGCVGVLCCCVCWVRVGGDEAGLCGLLLEVMRTGVLEGGEVVAWERSA